MEETPRKKRIAKRNNKISHTQVIDGNNHSLNNSKLAKQKEVQQLAAAPIINTLPSAPQPHTEQGDSKSEISGAEEEVILPTTQSSSGPPVAEETAPAQKAIAEEKNEAELLNSDHNQHHHHHRDHGLQTPPVTPTTPRKKSTKRHMDILKCESVKFLSRPIPGKPRLPPGLAATVRAAPSYHQPVKEEGKMPGMRVVFPKGWSRLNMVSILLLLLESLCSMATPSFPHTALI